MEKEIFRQFEKQFGDEWICSCGNPFKADWIETISQNKNSFLAKYHCRICGQEQVFAASADYPAELFDGSAFEIISSPLTSDDILDIKGEVANANLQQIRSLSKKKSPAKVSVSKFDHKHP